MDRDARLRHARELRRHGHIAEALVALAELQHDHPHFSRGHQERGHCHVLRRDVPAAIAALREAVRLNPTLPASWDMLERLYRMCGDAAQAAIAARHRTALAQLPEAVVMANSLLADGDLAPAEAVIRDHLTQDGDNVGALRLLARIRTRAEAHDEAAALLDRVLALAPDFDAARSDYAAALLLQQKYLPARLQAERLLRCDPGHRDHLKHYAAACIGLGDHEAVIDIYARLLRNAASAAEIADLRLWRANALKIAGRTSEAIADYRAALAARPDGGAAWYGLANLKTYRFTDEDIAHLRAAGARPDLPAMDRIYHCFALGAALEERSDHAGAWDWYRRGNALRSTTSRYRPGIAEARTNRLTQTCDADFFAARAGWGVADAAPIFVLGLPRSGSTLVEQILASHAAVEGTQELTEIGRYAGELCGIDADGGPPADAAALTRLTAAQAKALGERFLADTRPYRRLGRAYFVDKMPNNFWHIGLIHLILPRATIIDVRREPMACGFSNLKQLFGGPNQEFSYAMTHVARHYRTYLELMRHWDAVLPGRVLRVHYEDVVDDPERAVRRMLAHARLPFDPACLAFHATQRSVRTPSSEQVRRPIGRDGLVQWRHFAPWLTPLRDALGDAVTRYRD